jgi:SMC interacting uncharacterized protein involved in chromosome segregation
MILKTDSESMEDFKKLTTELSNMRRELDDVKEVLKGLIQVIMSREENVDGEEYN